MKVSFIVPIYNEEMNILRVIKNLKDLQIKKEIIIVDDGSVDSTPKLLENFKNDPEVLIHFSQLNFGKGTAIRVGLKYAKGDIIGIQDGDLEYDVNDWYKIIAKFIDPNVSVVYGSRFKGKMLSKMQWRFWFGNIILRILSNLLYKADITDEATAYKAFRSDLINSISLYCKRFEFCPEVTAKIRKLGHDIHEVPINYDPRTVDQGKKIRTKDGIIAIWTLLRLRVFNN